VPVGKEKKGETLSVQGEREKGDAREQGAIRVERRTAKRKAARISDRQKETEEMRKKRPRERA